MLLMAKNLKTQPLLLFGPSWPQSPRSLIPVSYNPSQINHLYPGLCARLCSHGNPSQDRQTPVDL